MTNLRAIDEKTGLEIKPGDIVKTFRGEEVAFVFARPRRVIVQHLLSGNQQEFFPSVIGARLEEAPPKGWDVAGGPTDA
jgi:hypothetical protein